MKNEFYVKEVALRLMPAAIALVVAGLFLYEKPRLDDVAYLQYGLIFSAVLTVVSVFLVWESRRAYRTYQKISEELYGLTAVQKAVRLSSDYSVGQNKNYFRFCSLDELKKMNNIYVWETISAKNEDLLLYYIEAKEKGW